MEIIVLIRQTERYQLTESDFGSFQEQDNVIRNLTKALEKEKEEKEALKLEVIFFKNLEY